MHPLLTGQSENLVKVFIVAFSTGRRHFSVGGGKFTCPTLRSRCSKEVCFFLLFKDLAKPKRINYQAQKCFKFSILVRSENVFKILKFFNFWVFWPGFCFLRLFWDFEIQSIFWAKLGLDKISSTLFWNLLLTLRAKLDEFWSTCWSSRRNVSHFILFGSDMVSTEEKFLKLNSA